jgi:hypothetical protein
MSSLAGIPIAPKLGLRILSSAITVLLVAAMFMIPNGSSAASFVLGLATGLSVAVVVMAWGSDLG